MIHIDDKGGLRKLYKELKELDPKLAKEIGKNNRETGRILVDKAKANASAAGGVLAKSVPAYQTSAEAARAVVVIDGKRYPYALGAEMGSKQGRRKRQFKMWRGKVPGDIFEEQSNWGFALGPASRSSREEVLRKWQEGMQALLDSIPRDL